MTKLQKRKQAASVKNIGISGIPNDERSALLEENNVDNDSHYRQRQYGGDKQPRKLNQNKQPNKENKIYLFILSGIAISILLYIGFHSQHASAPVGAWNTSSGPAVVTLDTKFTPLHPSAFTNFITSEESRNTLHGVLSWKVASVSWSWVPSKAFTALLPERSADQVPGYVWRLLPDTTANKYMLSYRYVPPTPSGPVEELLFQLLSLFHPQPFLQSRYEPRGAAAVVRARSSDSLDIMFRLHAEFQLNTSPRRPLWFTPAAFIGRLIINTTEPDVKYFSMHVPAHMSLNVDLEWLIGPNEDKDMEVNITHLEEMSIRSRGSVDPDTLTWMQQIHSHEALSLLEKELYKFMQVEYHNFTEAYVKASHEGRPVHSVILWGVLNDQSC